MPFNNKTKFEPSKHQAAGHDGCLISDSIFVKPTIKQELEFYSYINTIDQSRESNSIENDDIYLGSLLSHWMPKFYGNLKEGTINETKESNKLDLNLDDNSSISLTQNSKNVKDYIVLQNLYHNFKKPNIMDIKLGSKLTDDSKTTEEKIKRLNKVSCETTSGSHSFRICGMKVFNNQKILPDELFEGMNDTILDDKDDYFQFNKFFGRSFDSNNIKQGIELFFKLSMLSPIQISHLIDIFLKRLQLIYNCLLDYEVRMFSASLLFIYEGDPKVWNEINSEDFEDVDPLIKEPEISDDEESEEIDDNDKAILNDYKVVKNLIDKSPANSSPPLSSLNLIDFAHSKPTPNEGYDENVIRGIENLIKIFTELQEKI
ncbi:hypothetical protein KGF54_003170 [Candida jiufengensis]|uniref:uncharacterized protein n=1 Tax=Candida jiufengensis TaxID=497108 RepID=UPI0022259D40|nr:uncharacterized protein KGF54_003170 [Candida jiufengensis]KAI5952304.1 hypothetical protein KGF54_003170 [Candida jiufengensis]